MKSNKLPLFLSIILPATGENIADVNRAKVIPKVKSTLLHSKAFSHFNSIAGKI